MKNSQNRGNSKQRKVAIAQHPANLRPDGQRLWQIILEQFDVPQDMLVLLEMACQSYDRMCFAGRILDAEGLVVADRFGQSKQHPLFIVERDSRLATAKLLKQLGLDVQPPPAK